MAYLFNSRTYNSSFKIALGMLFFILSVQSCSLDKRIIRADKKYLPRAPYDVIIVPGYPFYDTDTAPFPLMQARMNWAKELYQKGLAKNIIFSGGAVHTPYNEAKIMALYADSMGLPANHIYLEEVAPHSAQNVKYSCKLAKKLGFKKVAIATDPYQFSYIVFFKIFRPKVGLLTFQPANMGSYVSPLPAINASSLRVKDFVPLKER